MAPLKKIFNHDEMISHFLGQEGDDSLISIEANARRRFYQNCLFVASMLMTFAAGKYLWLARIGWTLLAILYVIDLRYSVYSAFFFAAWFHGAGFMPNLGFTIKHFHIAVFLSIAVDAFKSNTLQVFLAGIQKGKYLFFIVAILALGILNSALYATGIESVRTPGNISLILFAVFYLLGLMEQFGKEDLIDLLQKALLYFLSAICMIVGLCVFNRYTETYYLDLHLIHNNHIGILCSFSIFYALSLLMSAKNWKMRAIYGAISMVIFAALITSCSRTSWLSFLTGLLFYSTILIRFKKISLTRYFAYVMPLLAACIGVIAVVSGWSKATFERLNGLPQLLDGNYWQYTLFDRNNFGFLGRFRLQQFFVLNDIFKTHFLAGEGFKHEIVDFHGLYFCIMGATGVLGLILFALFSRFLIRRLVDQLKVQTSHSFIYAGALTAFIVWLFVSFLESYYVQFSAWLNVLIVLTLISSGNLLTQDKSCRK